MLVNSNNKIHEEETIKNPAEDPVNLIKSFVRVDSGGSWSNIAS